MKPSFSLTYSQKILLLVLLVLVTFFFNLGALPTDIMETRNMLTAREIVDEGNWMVPTMNGELRLEKPPLPTWVAAAIWSVSPQNLAVQRIAAGVMGCVWTLFLFLFARYLSKREDFPIYTTVVFLTCYNVVLMGRSATWDIYCHAFMMGAIYFLWRALEETGKHWPSFIGAGVLMGLSFLSKGPVSFYALLLPAVVAMLVGGKISLRGKLAPFCVMIIAMLVVGGWWYTYLIVLHPEAVEAVVHKESGSWVNHNVRPWYYYWRFFVEMGAWALLMLSALIVPWWKKHICVRREYLVSIIWSVCALILLSLMPEKKTRYLLPMLAPCSMAVACVLMQVKERAKNDTLALLTFRLTCVVVAVVCFVLPPAYIILKGISGPTVLVGLILIWLLTVIMVRALLRISVGLLVSGVAMVFIVAEIFLLPAIGNSFSNPDAYSISHIRNDRKLNEIPLYYIKKDGIRAELVYAAGRKILPIDLNDSIAVIKAMPCIILTHPQDSLVWPAFVLSCADTVPVGIYDDNKHSRRDSHYNRSLISRLTLIKAKALPAICEPQSVGNSKSKPAKSKH